MSSKVIHTSLYYFELSENWIHTQLKHLRGWEPLVLTNEARNLDTVQWRPEVYARRQALPPVIRELDSVAMRLIGYYPSFLRRARRAGADLIHAHFGPMGYLSLGLARKLDIPLVTTFYGYDASELPREEPGWKENYRDLFTQGASFLVEGPAMGAKLRQLGCPSEKITIQHLGIEPDRYPARTHYRGQGPLRILMVGRFVEKKGFPYGLQAFRRFLQQGGEGTLTIVGDSNGTEASERLRRQMHDYVAEHAMGDRVHFRGLIPLEALSREYYEHDLFLAPSITASNGDDEGGLPVTVIEAAATGMALAGSRHCDIPEVIQPGRTGLLAEEKGVDELAAHLLTLYRKPGLRRAYGQSAARLATSAYNAEKQGATLSELYEALL